MNRHLDLLVISGMLLSACGDSPLEGISGTVAFVGVSVVPMDEERVLADQTVIVRDARIAWVGPVTEAVVDADATVIDGAGLYLMPGLADMHVHTWRDEDQLLFVAYGVTTVRNMWGTDIQLEIRDRIGSGALLGPTIITAGPLMDGDPPFWDGSLVVTDPDSARLAVRDQKTSGYDFVKPYNRLSVSVYEAIIDEATRVGLPVAGHVPLAVGLNGVIAGSQVSIEHLNRYATLLQRDPPDMGDSLLGESGWITANASLMPGLASRLAADELWSVPTLVLWERAAFTAAERDAFVAMPEVRFVAPDLRQLWIDFSASPAFADIVRQGMPARRTMVRMLRDAGAPLLLGTDVGNPYLIPGRSVHGELAALVAAGLTPFEALSAATRDAAAFLGQEGEFGVVAPGARADLLLVEGDPLADVRNAGRRAGVMVRGRWFTEAALRDRMDALADGLETPWVRRSVSATPEAD